MRQIESFVTGRWQAGAGESVVLRDATTGRIVAHAAVRGPDSGAMLQHARSVGGPNLRRLTFHERAGLLKRLAKALADSKDELYALSYHTGATNKDSWLDVDGGISTLFVYAGKGLRELPGGGIYVDGALESLSRNGSFIGQHVWMPLEGVAIHINAFNFPVWGMLEKLAQSLLAGVPAIVKPATATSHVAESAFRRIIESGILPEGAVQLLCGGVGDLFDHLTCQDIVSFTGSASTAAILRRHPNVIARSVRFTAETDSVNASIMGPDVDTGQPEFGLYVREVVREMTIKAGQRCTAIRRAIVPAAQVDEVLDALRSALGGVVIGDPRLEEVKMGPLVSLSQRSEVLDRLTVLRSEAELIHGNPGSLEPRGSDVHRGAFVCPTLLYCRDAGGARSVHSVEAFGPVCTVIPYVNPEQAVALARRGEGSLASSVFTADERAAADLIKGLAPFHGRVLVVNRDCAKDSTGHGSPLPHLVHGGPGRAGGGEEMGGIRGVLRYMQRTAIQGTPDVLTALTGRYTKGARQLDPNRHPFHKPFGELRVGDTLRSGERAVTVEDIEAFGHLGGDEFYVHMDDAAAQRNPFFRGRIAHGYFLISAAAGLFVDPAYGPVLANYGLEALRFVKPVRPGDRIRVRLTCKEKALRPEKDYGEVRWDTEISNQDGETIATYDVLTLVSIRAVPDASE